jgi:hypothetical protein
MFYRADINPQAEVQFSHVTQQSDALLYLELEVGDTPGKLQ